MRDLPDGVAVQVNQVSAVLRQIIDELFVFRLAHTEEEDVRSVDSIDQCLWHTTHVHMFVFEWCTQNLDGLAALCNFRFILRFKDIGRIQQNTTEQMQNVV